MFAAPSAERVALSSEAVCRLTKTTYRQLDCWVRVGLVTPSISEARGSGTQRRFSFEDVKTVAVVKALMPLADPLIVGRAVDLMENDYTDAEALWAGSGGVGLGSWAEAAEAVGALGPMVIVDLHRLPIAA